MLAAAVARRIITTEPTAIPAIAPASRPVGPIVVGPVVVGPACVCYEHDVCLPSLNESY